MRHRKLIRYALDQGVNRLDSSDMYGWGHNETLVGRAIKGRRNEVVLATKFGQIRRDGQPNGVDGRAEYVQQACEASLARLGVDVIDLYYQHRVDPSVPVEETVGAMARLVQQGKVRFIGLSEAHPDRIAAPTPFIRSRRSRPYSLLYREEAEETRRTTTELAISFVAYSPLGRGFLTGALRTLDDIDGRRSQHPRFQNENFAANRRLVTHVEELAKQTDCTPAQVALAWLLAQGEDVVADPGTRRREALDENIGALEIKLTVQEAAMLSAAIPPGAAAGTRYPAGGMSGVYV